MLKNKLAVNLLLTILLLGLIAGVSINVFHSPLNNGNFQFAKAATLVPVPGAIVSATGGIVGSGSAVANSQGQYSITSFLDSGNYTVDASAPGFIDQQVNNVVVVAGSQTSNVNIVMNVSGGISGKVTDAVSGSPLSFAIVSVEKSDGSSTGSAFTDSNGNWQIIQNLQTGTYNVTVQSYSSTIGYLQVTRSAISVTAGSMTSNVNIALPRSGIITGTVTDAISSAALSGLSVEAVYPNGTYASFASTNSTGQYTINSNLPTGTYNVTVASPTGYFTKTVGSVSVTAPSTTTVNIALTRSGVISGKVTNSANGQPISGAIISASFDSVSGYASTDVNGNYNISTDLTTGSYSVTAFYGSNFVTNPSVSVVAGQTTANINFQLAVPSSGTISGKVTTSAGALSGASVNAQGVGGSGSVTTDSNGNYVINTGLGTGTYTVSVTDAGFVSQQQTGVAVTVNQVTPNVNFVLVAAPTGIISGQVLSSQASPFPTPTPIPTTAPTATPTVAPTATPTAAPTATPTAVPTAIPTVVPTNAPTAQPTQAPTATAKPTATPTTAPKGSPTATPKIPEIPAQLLEILLAVSLIMVLSAAIVARKHTSNRITQQ